MPEMTPEIERELAALDDALAGRRVASDLTELGELALALRAERPAIDAGFAGRLDERARRGFSDEEPRRAGVSGRRWWTALLSAPAFATGLAVALVALVVVIGNGGDGTSMDGAGGGSSSSSGSTSSSDFGTATDAGGGATAAADSAGSSGAESSAAPEESTGIGAPGIVPPSPGPGSPRTDGKARRSVERSASLTLAARSRDVDSVSSGIQRVADEQGGFVISANVNESQGGGDGTFELRVPTRNLDATMAALAKLHGVRVRERSQRSQDITAQAVSARSRLREAKTERESLLRQLADSDTVTGTLAIRARLRIVGAQIEAARADVRRVRNRASFSTVSVTLISDNSATPPPADDNWTPGDAAHDALRVLEVAAGVALIALAIVVPLALLALPALLGARWTRRRRREHALDAV